MVFFLPRDPLSSISTQALSVPVLTNSDTFLARPKTCWRTFDEHQFHGPRGESGGMKYRSGESKTNDNGTSNGTLSSPVGADNHIQVGTRAELDLLIGQEVLAGDSHNRARHVATTSQAHVSLRRV